MAAAAKVVFSHITKSPGVCGGKACIDDTRIRVMDIVVANREGRTPEEIRTLFAVPLTLAQVYSALAYAAENATEIEADFARDEETEAQVERNRAEFLKRTSPR